MRHTLKAILIAMMLAGVGPATAGELVTEQFEHRNDRLYLPVGEETRIYKHARLSIVRDNDTLYFGLIEHAWQGVSISASVGDQIDTLALEGATAMIETAEIDSVSSVVLGTNLTELQLWPEGTDTGRVEIRAYRDRMLMLEDFHAGLLDGLIGFEDLEPRLDGVTTVARPAPYLVALVPHVGRPVNYQGQLTTSLYYRFDLTRLDFTFEGDDLAIITAFEPDELLGPRDRRLFDYDPERGRRLFESLTNPPQSLSIHSAHPVLDGLAHYFADIIARDRCPVQIVDQPSGADVRLVFVPVSRSLPSATIYSLYHQLTVDSMADLTTNEHLRRIAAELGYVETGPRLEDYYRHLRNAGRIMIEELGLFPLFRPTVFVHTHRRLLPLSFDADNRLDLSSVTLLQLPQPPPEVDR